MSKFNAGIHRDFLVAQELIYGQGGFEASKPQVEPESAEYGACAVDMNGKALIFRVSKITPTKVGQFVTFWKRTGNGPIQPFDAADRIDFLVVSCRKGQLLGQFVFPQSVLCERDVLSLRGEGGKRAIRVYPPWDRPTSHQALKTQTWQLPYFLETPEDRPIDLARARQLYHL
ncbi:MepB family protein [Microvirga soli]|uniref:MepB family protein n=1 Tax=Microvirga soli TaxID=1854496 RepID=UPI00191E1EEC|nr:MepB family protein [Microvirga soli]